MKHFLIMDSKYNTIEIPGDVLRQILVMKYGKQYTLDIKQHTTQTALFDEIRAYLRQKDEPGEDPSHPTAESVLMGIDPDEYLKREV